MKSTIKKQKNYIGWELSLFDQANIYRDYQFSFLKNNIRGNVCEVGPGHGVICDRYIHLSKKISLFEQSKKLFKFLKKKYKKNQKIKIYNKYFKPSKTKYHTILYLDVLEHIEQPKKELKKVFMSLKKRGKIIFVVPAYQHLFSQFDKDVGHYKRYSKKDFMIILKKLSFRKVSFKYYDSIGYLLSLMSKLFITNYKKNFEKKIKFWNNLIFLSKLLDKITLNAFGKSLLVIIEK